MSADSISALQEALAHFYAERDWERFQTLKDLAASAAAEAGELLAHLLWIDEEAAQRVVAERRAAIEAELADVVINCLNFARRADVDLGGAVLAKLEALRERYPVETVRGRVVSHGGGR